MSLHRPLAKNNDRESSTGQILLVPDVPIGSQGHIESSGFRRVQQLADSDVSKPCESTV
jgi:hypothetical protein